MTPCPHARPLPHLPCPYPGCHAAHPGVGTHIVATTANGHRRRPLMLDVACVKGDHSECWRQPRYLRVPTHDGVLWHWQDVGPG